MSARLLFFLGFGDFFLIGIGGVGVPTLLISGLKVLECFVGVAEAPYYMGRAGKGDSFLFSFSFWFFA